MTVNSLALNNSTAVAGLGTSTYNVVTAGFYIISVKSFVSYIPSGQAIASQPAKEITQVSCVGDSAGSLNSTYFTFNSAANFKQYYAWYNVDGGGTDPAISDKTAIEVDIPENAQDTEVAQDTRLAIATAASQYITATGDGGINVILTNKQTGACTDAVDGAAPTTFGFSITQGSFGVPPASGLNFIIKQNSTTLASFGIPDPNQEVLLGSTIINAAAGDVITVVLSSTSIADNAPNAVKTIINLSQGEN